MSTLQAIRTVLGILPPRERRQLAGVTALSLILALFETLGVASIIPFLAVLADPEIVERNRRLAELRLQLGSPTIPVFLLGLGAASALIITAGSALRIAIRQAVVKFVSLQRHALSVRLFENYLGRPYTWYLNRNGADLAKGVLTESHEVASGLLRPLMELIAGGAVVLLLVAFMVVLDPRVALGVTVATAAGYGVAWLVIQGVTRKLGEARVAANRHRYTLVVEAFESIKTVKMRGIESAYLEGFRNPSEDFAAVQARHALVQQLPRFAIETVALALGVGLAALLVAGGRDFAATIPLLGAWALAGYRLLPAFQRVFTGLVQIRFGTAALESFAGEMQEAPAEPLTEDGAPSPEASGPIPLRENLRLEGVTFRHSGSRHPSLEGAELTFDARTTVGVVGATGAGKTTLVDLVAGLLEPTEGRVLADGAPLPDLGIRRWRRSVGYVPQHVHVADATMAMNIALGVPPDAIDEAALRRAAEMAQLHTFVETRLPLGYETRVGERGVRLSGGERQRVGIARALYFDPDLLILDEGTSALDGVTEATVLDAIRGLRHRKTILLVAHRLSTVRECDRIVVLERGRVVGDGEWETLLEGSPTFRKLARSAGVA